MDTSTFQFEQFQSFSPYSELGPYRARDYWKLSEGEPVELLRGRLIKSPSPSSLHQTVIARLICILQRAEDAADGLMFVSPMDVILSDDTILQPDLLYIAKDRRGIVGERVMGPPDLVIEILSPGSDRRDRTEKLDLYTKYDVAEYWIVDPETQLFEFLLLEQGRYTVVQPADNAYQSPRLPEIEFNLATFWQEVQRRLSRS
ncbi:MAG: Uma2 family endonuclease [Planctomycetes bacterium]|nr:Uma2 family endonuclease [Planctomycetota bacterium]